jgi:dTDP-glucose 4,6-dehydratase/UDP-glucose 4-epimerase
MQTTRVEYDIGTDVDVLIERSEINPRRLRGKTILVTGGTGFFGVWLLSALARIRQRLDGDLRIIALSRHPSEFLSIYPNVRLDQSVEFVTGDVMSAKLDPEWQITHLVHMATTRATETFQGEDQLRKVDLLYRGTQNILEQCGASLESVLLTSSGVVYGAGTGAQRMSEADRSGPDTLDRGSALAIGKLAAEYLVTYFAKDLGYRYSIARCFAFAGQYLPLDLHYAFGNFIRDAALGKDIVILGDGQDVRSYLYIGDAIAWLLALLVDPRDTLFNVGSSSPVDMEALARKIAAAAAQPVRIVIEGRDSQVGNFRRTSYVPSTEKIRTEYPFIHEWTPLDEIIDKMLH